MAQGDGARHADAVDMADASSGLGSLGRQSETGTGGSVELLYAV
jgi:hypothetical protein